MRIFDDSDKKSQNWLDFSDLEMIDLSRDLNTALSPESMVFGKFTKDEITKLMDEVGLLQLLSDRGYPNFKIEVNVLSELDNRIFIKTLDNQILVHMRLKYSDFSLREESEIYKMVYIDWLLTQNVRFRPGTYKKGLFYGQEYPGLAIFIEITNFIRILTKKLGAHGVFNIPEYFHDAVLFRNNFRFMDPIKEGQFRAILSLGLKYRIRELSDGIHNNKLLWSNSKEIFQWFYGEMLTTIDPYLERRIFNDEYFKKVHEVKESSQFYLDN